MVFLFYIISIIFILFILFITSIIEIDFLKFNYETKKKIKVDLKIKVYILKKIPIFSIRLTNKRIRKIENTSTFKEIESILKNQISEIEKEIITSREKIDKEIVNKLINILKKIKIKIKKIKLNVEIGTQNIILTSFLVPIISTIVSFFVKQNSKYLEEIDYKILPKYKIREDFFKTQISLETKLEIKTIEVLILIKQIRQLQRKPKIKIKDITKKYVSKTV